jgi:superfamily II RNA helicase
VHILNENRGSVLEVVIARMKTRGTAVRFVMVSATVPNIKDIANWIRSTNDNGPAMVFQVSALISNVCVLSPLFKFGEEFSESAQEHVARLSLNVNRALQAC